MPHLVELPPAAKLKMLIERQSMHPLRSPSAAFLALSVFLIAAPAGCAGEDEQAKSLRASIVKAQLGPDENSDEVAEAYKQLYEHVGVQGIRKLADDEDISISLQAAWETHKKVVARNPPIAGKSFWVFDEKSVEAFLAFFAKRIGADPPDWWRSTLRQGVVFPGRHHAFSDLAEGLPARPKVEIDQDHVIIRGERQSVRILRNAVERTVSFEDENAAVAVTWGDEQSFIAGPEFRGYPFQVFSVNSQTNEIVWTASVWAARRDFSTGTPSRNPLEIRRQGDQVVVYGCDSHGMFAEGFDAKTGNCKFRFCTCYWFHFSEKWNVK
jgi:hypothetical protein